MDTHLCGLCFSSTNNVAKCVPVHTFKIRFTVWATGCAHNSVSVDAVRGLPKWLCHSLPAGTACLSPSPHTLGHAWLSQASFSSTNVTNCIDLNCSSLTAISKIQHPHFFVDHSDFCLKILYDLCSVFPWAAVFSGSLSPLPLFVRDLS